MFRNRYRLDGIFAFLIEHDGIISYKYTTDIHKGNCIEKVSIWQNDIKRNYRNRIHVHTSGNLYANNHKKYFF